jgi:hypothetical protein
MSEFKAWERAHDPAALDDLLPGGKLVPDLARARRWKRDLTQWRAATGLSPVE